MKGRKGTAKSGRMSRGDFERLVRRALRKLYEPVELQFNPLGDLLGVGGEPDTPTKLRQRLIDAIRALKPGARVALDSSAWRIYQVLCYRFEEQAEQEKVIQLLALSPRQVSRIEHTAIEALADYLVKCYSLAGVIYPAQVEEETTSGQESESAPLLDRAQDGLNESSPETRTEDAAVTSLDQKNEQELDWLRRAYPFASASVSDLVQSALQTSDTLLKSSGCLVETHLVANLPPVMGQVTILRQALINLLVAAARRAPGGSILIEARMENGRVFVEVSSKGVLLANEPLTVLPEVSEFMDLAARLLGLTGGVLEDMTTRCKVNFAAQATLQTVQVVDVLFIDDNEDSLRLFERYLDGTHFRFHGERDPLTALATAESCGARVVVLDIMLPNIDGWELLGRIKAHPRLGNVPVVISTILPLEELAHILGASGFLHKPVVREPLLSLLGKITQNKDGLRE